MGCDLHKEELYTFFRELYMYFIVNRVELPWQAQPNICYWLDTSTYKPLVTSYHLNQLDALIDQWDQVLSSALASVKMLQPRAGALNGIDFLVSASKLSFVTSSYCLPV